MEASDIQRLRELESKNARLKHMFADLSLEYQILKEVVEKSSEHRTAATDVSEHALSERRVPDHRLSRSVKHYQAHSRDDEDVVSQLKPLSASPETT